MNGLFTTLSLIITISLLIQPSSVSGAVTVSGRLLEEGRPVSGAAVMVFDSADLSGDPVKLVRTVEPDGTYSLSLEPGRYMFVASTNDSWAYCGQNPVTVSADDLWIGFELKSWKEPVYKKIPGDGIDGQVRGRVTLNGKPAGGVTISLYLDAEDGFRGLGYIRSAPTGKDGKFILDLVPESRYYILARKRESGRLAGPVLKGDLFSYYRYNPVHVKGGKSVMVDLPLQEKKKKRDVYAVGLVGRESGFSGVVVDSEGKPVKGLHVFAYTEPEMSHHRPAALSSITDADGKYRIFLARGGKYYIGAREGFGDSPMPGEYFGYYDGSPDHSIEVDQGRFMDGIDMTVGKVLAE